MARSFAALFAFALAIPSPAFAQSLAKIPAVESDPLPPHAERRLGTNRLRLPTRVGYFMFSPDDSTLMIGSGPDVYFWDTKTWKQTWKIDAGAFSCSPDGTHVAKRADDFTVEIWDAKKRAIVHTRNLARFGRNYRIFDIEFNHKGDLLWVGVTRQGVWLYDWANDKIVQRIEMPDVMESSLYHSRDRKAFLLQNQNGFMNVFDGVTAKRIREVKATSEWQALSHDGKQLAAGNWQPGSHFKFWDVATGAKLSPLPDLPNDLKPKADDNDPPDPANDPFFDRSRIGHRVLYDTKGDYLFLVGAKVLTVDLKKKAIVANVALPGLFPQAFAISHDNKTIAIGYEDGSVELRNPLTLQPLIDDSNPRGPALGVAFSRDGQTLATFNASKTAVRLWNPRDGRLLKAFDVDDPLFRSLPHLSFADDDRRINLGAAHSWKVGGERVPTPARKDRALTSAAGGARWLFAKDNDQGEVSEMTLDDLVAGRELMKLPLDLGPDAVLASYYLRSSLSADGAFAALHKRITNRRDPNTGELRTLEESIVVWNVQGAKPTPVFSTLCRRVPKAIELSPTGQFLAVQGEPSAEHPHQLWHVPTGFALWKATSDPASKAPPRQPQSLPEDGDWLDLQEVLRFDPESAMTGAVAFSPDSQFVAVAGHDGITLREALSGATLVKLTGQTGRVGGLAFSPDGRRLASATSDSTVMLWTVPMFGAAKAGAWKRDTFETLWNDLKSDAASAYQAMADLHAGGDEAVALLKDKLRAESDDERRLIVQTLADLASPRFQTREKASVQLEKWSFRLKPYLASAIAQSSDLEQKRRLISIQERSKSVGIDPEELRLNRSAFVLERIGTPGARVILENLSRGHANDLTSQTARAALSRMQK